MQKEKELKHIVKRTDELTTILEGQKKAHKLLVDSNFFQVDKIDTNCHRYTFTLLHLPQQVKMSILVHTDPN